MKWAVLALWTASIAGVWLMPVRAVIVVTAAAVSGTCAAVTDDRAAGRDEKISALFAVMDDISETMGVRRGHRADLSIVRRADDA